jgi:putative phosphoribosyl transferase
MAATLVRTIEDRIFRDRRDAGIRLAAELGVYASKRPIVLALPRGGVPVACEIARALRAPLDVWLVAKVPVPARPELAAGAVAEDGTVRLNDAILLRLGLTREGLAAAIEGKRRQIVLRGRLYHGDRARPDLRRRTVILVDDGMATGATARAAAASIRAQNPRAIVLAIPVAEPIAVKAIAPEVDAIVCPRRPPDLQAIGLWYEDFRQVSEREALRLLARARRAEAAEAGGRRSTQLG